MFVSRCDSTTGVRVLKIVKGCGSKHGVCTTVVISQICDDVGSVCVLWGVRVIISGY